jgi:ureidoglycolate lyase
MATAVETEVVTITAEPITPEAFAPFGTVLSAEGQERLPIDLYGDRVNVFRPAPLDADPTQPMEWLYTENRIREFRVLFLERHMQLAQAFIPMGGDPIISCVAAPDCRLENEIPAFDEVRAFIIPGGIGAQIHRGTWHEPPFPLVDRSYTLITSHQALTAGLGLALNESREIGDLDVDKRNITERTGKILRIALP